MMAVAEVVVSRVNDDRWPDDACSVVKQGYVEGRVDCQFSFYCDGRSDAVPDSPEGDMARKLAIRYADMADDERRINTAVVDGANHYHASYVTPYWSKHPRMRLVAIVGDHLFYVLEKKEED